MRERLVVILNADDKVVATQRLDQVAPAVPDQLEARLVAGPDQQRREVELDVNLPTTRDADVEAFHAQVEAALRTLDQSKGQ